MTKLKGTTAAEGRKILVVVPNGWGRADTYEEEND